MRILITGGAGFLGAALANHLVDAGHHVRVLDDLSAGDPSALDDRVLFTRGDVRDIPKLWTLLRDIDVVYHLAARVSVPESVLYPVEYNAVNTGGTVSLMTAMRDAGVNRVVMASSATIYGEQPVQPTRETAEPHPPNPYAVSKLAAEHYVRAIGGLYDIETVILRIFNAYGPGQAIPPAHAPVIPKFVKRALSGESVVVWGDGEQTRDYIYVDDVVAALAAAGEAPVADGTIINVGCGRETSVNELVRKIGEAVNKEIHPLYNQERSGGVRRSVADITRARELLGWEPRVSLDEGLRRLVAHYQRQMKQVA
ncbi:MAG: NAD-dependent epimerase/dehydratase family protein [Chloroflexi bacterium]|nr:MAG: NAD-dependent epimerase/dehydratase family protein [Chloroflexota bacterium]